MPWTSSTAGCPRTSHEKAAERKAPAQRQDQKEVVMDCIRNAVGDALAAIVSPSPGQLARRDAFVMRHPALMLAALAALLLLYGWAGVE